MDTHSALMCGHTLAHTDMCAGHIAITKQTHSQCVIKMPFSHLKLNFGYNEGAAPKWWKSREQG